MRAIEESVNRTHLFTQAAILGGLLVVLSLVNQYGKGIVRAESAYVRMKLTDMLNDHLMDCSYDMLGDKKVMQSLSQASQRIWSMQVRIRLPSFPQWQVWSCILRCCQSFHFG